MGKRWQFSLRSLLLMAITLGALAGFYFAQKRSNELLAENRQLRDELGEVTVDDRSKIWIRAGTSTDRPLYRWRIFVPKSTLLRFTISERQPNETEETESKVFDTRVGVEHGTVSVELEIGTRPDQSRFVVFRGPGDLNGHEAPLKADAKAFPDWLQYGSTSTWPASSTVLEVNQGVQLMMHKADPPPPAPKLFLRLTALPYKPVP